MSDESESVRRERRADGNQTGPAPEGAARPGILHRLALGVVAAILMGLGIWILVAAVGAPGPAFARVGVAAIGLLILAPGVWFSVRAACALGRRDADEDYGRRVKERAQQLGMPTDPAAYQDGGVGVAATAGTVAEAEMMATRLNAQGIAAWANQPHASTTLSHAQFAINPDGVRVLVPLGRLDDAKAILAQHEEDGAADSLEQEPQD